MTDWSFEMGTVRKTITLTEQQDAWIGEQIAAGSYTNDSEAIRDLIRREQERSFELETIRQALIEGEHSGEPEPFDLPLSSSAKPRNMADIVSPRAQRDLDAIFDYTVTQWGLSQALRYADLTKRHASAWPSAAAISNCAAIRPGYRRRNVEQHILYFRQASYGIAVIRILHQRMDAPRHLLKPDERRRKRFFVDSEAGPGKNEMGNPNQSPTVSCAIPVWKSAGLRCAGKPSRWRQNAGPGSGWVRRFVRPCGGSHQEGGPPGVSFELAPPAAAGLATDT